MNEFRSIISDLKNRRFIESYVLLLVGIGVLVFDIIGDVPSSVINEVILAVLSVLIYLSILERRDYYKLLDHGEQIEGITVFHTNRDFLFGLKILLNQATSEIDMLAVQHGSLRQGYLELLEEKAKSGCKIRILMMSPRDKDNNPNPNVISYEAQNIFPNLLAKLNSCERDFQNWLHSLDEQIRKNVQIKMYFSSPAATYFFIDKQDAHGFVQVELLLPYIPIQKYPHYVVTKKNDEGFFKVHIDSFEKLWTAKENTIPVEF